MKYLIAFIILINLLIPSTLSKNKKDIFYHVILWQEPTPADDLVMQVPLWIANRRQETAPIKQSITYNVG